MVDRTKKQATTHLYACSFGGDFPQQQTSHIGTTKFSRVELLVETMVEKKRRKGTSEVPFHQLS